MPNYVFDPDVIHACALERDRQPQVAHVDAFADAMETEYPGVLDRSQPWLEGDRLGGAMIEMKLYDASLDEYVMVWGTPIGSEGHSGRHRVGFWDTVIDGETWYFAEGEFEKRVYKPGDRIYVGPGQACGMNFTDGVLGRSNTSAVRFPRSLPFGLADELMSCLDFQTAAQTVSLYTDSVSRHYGPAYALRPLPVVGPAAKLVTGLVGDAARKMTDWLEPSADAAGDAQKTTRAGTDASPAPHPFMLAVHRRH